MATTTTATNDAARVRPLVVKMTMGEDIRKMKLMMTDQAPEAAFKALAAKMATAYGEAADKLLVKYTDLEGDLVTVASPDDLVLALEELPTDTPLRLTVSRKAAAAPTPASAAAGPSLPIPLKMLKEHHQNFMKLHKQQFHDLMHQRKQQQQQQQQQQPAQCDEQKQCGGKKKKLLPDALRKMLKGVSQPARKALRQALKAAWPPKAPQAPRTEKETEPELPEAVLNALKDEPSPEVQEAVLQVLTGLWGPTAASPEESAALEAALEGAPPELVEAARAAWPQAAAHRLTTPKFLPAAVRHALAAVPGGLPAQQAMRKRLRALWFPDEEELPLPPRAAAGLAMMHKLGVGCGARMMVRFVAHATVEDGARVAPGAVVTKGWTVRNDSGAAWPQGAQLVCISGGALRAPPTPVGAPAQPGETVTLEAGPITAPDAPGLYEAHFRLQGPNGWKFGQRLKVSLLVDGGEANKQPAAAAEAPAEPPANDDDDDGFVPLDKPTHC